MAKNGGKTLSEHIYAQLRHDIIMQKIPCGKKLTLQELKDTFEVSHTPIREALTRLSEEGLVTYQSNCGVTVHEFSEQEIQELYQFAAELDATSVRLCQHLFSPAPLLFELQRALDRCDEALAAGDHAAWQGYSEDFHLAFFHNANNRYLNDASRKVQAKISLLGNLYTTEANTTRVQQEHQAIVDAIADGDFERAADLMRKHTQEDVVFALEAYREKLS